mmetsp:Transcript_43302/g.97875  ORF Transcript_43302/g.97875 Transcript_43302/m.97875 type:complete len:221 (+) Transcript_43302:633-1295(+)
MSGRPRSWASFESHASARGHPTAATIASRPCFSSASRSWRSRRRSVASPRGSNPALPARAAAELRPPPVLVRAATPARASMASTWGHSAHGRALLRRSRWCAACTSLLSTGAASPGHSPTTKSTVSVARTMRSTTSVKDLAVQSSPLMLTNTSPALIPRPAAFDPGLSSFTLAPGLPASISSRTRPRGLFNRTDRLDETGADAGLEAAVDLCTSKEDDVW